MFYWVLELFDVKMGMVVDIKVDIWSMGCMLYVCLVGKLLFEMRLDEMGGLLSICVLSGDWRFLDEGLGVKKNKGKGLVFFGGVMVVVVIEEEGISELIWEVVRRCLRVELSERLDIDELIEMVEWVLEVLFEDVV